MAQFYHFKTLRKYTAALLDLFSNIPIVRYNEAGEVIDSFIVPLEFGQKSKAYIFSNTDIEKIKSGNVNILPRMSLTIDGLDRDSARNTSKFQQINQKAKTTLEYEYQYNAQAYLFKYSLSIATKTLDDMSIILEQILPQFSPTISLKIREFDAVDTFTTINVLHTGTQLDIPSTPEEDVDIRMVKAELTFELKGNFYPPTKVLPRGKKAILNILVQNENLAENLPNGTFSFVNSDKTLVTIETINETNKITLSYPLTYSDITLAGIVIIKDFDSSLHFSKEGINNFSVIIAKDYATILHDGLSYNTLFDSFVYFIENFTDILPGTELYDKISATTITVNDLEYTITNSRIVKIPKATANLVLSTFKPMLFTTENPINSIGASFSVVKTLNFENESC